MAKKLSQEARKRLVIATTDEQVGNEISDLLDLVAELQEKIEDLEGRVEDLE